MRIPSQRNRNKVCWKRGRTFVLEGDWGTRRDVIEEATDDCGEEQRLQHAVISTPSQKCASAKARQTLDCLSYPDMGSQIPINKSSGHKDDESYKVSGKADQSSMEFLRLSIAKNFRCLTLTILVGIWRYP